MEKANKDLREFMKSSNVKQWELADRLKIASSRICELLRHELPAKKKYEFIALIQEIVDERKAVEG